MIESTVRDLARHTGADVRVRGWVQGRRSSGGIVFLLVRDGTGTVQCVVEKAAADAFEAAQRAAQESSLAVVGAVREEPRSPGGVELAVRAVDLIQVAHDYPVSRKAHGTDFLFSHRHLWLRSERQTAILRIRHTIVRAARAFFDDDGFTLIDTPILSPGAAEGAGTLFHVDYFGEEVHLAQTGQLYAEAAAMALGKVYCFGPTFRAEKSKTRRHLTEFWMLEPEVAFADLADIESLAERCLSHIVQAVLAEHRADLEALGRDTAALERVVPPFPRLTYSEAVETLRSDAMHGKLTAQLESDRARLAEMRAEAKRLASQLAQTTKAWKKEKLEHETKALHDEIQALETDLDNRPAHIEDARGFEWGRDLGGDEETILSKEFDRPLIVTRYPREAKAFYMKRDEEDPRTVLNLDVLAPEGYGEIIGGSQREDSLDALLERMAEFDLAPEDYDWYLDLRRYGTVPHGGFGLGLERTVAWICGLKHVRETAAFPRLMGRIHP